MLDVHRYRLQSHEPGADLEDRQLPQPLVRDLERLDGDLVASRPSAAGPSNFTGNAALERPDVVRDVLRVHQDDQAVLALHLPLAEVVEPVPAALRDARHAALEREIRSR